MHTLLKNKLAFMSASFVLLMIAFPLISIGTTRGPAALWWAGLIALGCGALIPPLRRLLMGAFPAEADPASRPDENENPPI
jgi:hypothetical protein